MSAWGIGGRVVEQHVAPRLPHLAPDLTASFVREALERAIHGAGPLPAAADAADKQLREVDGDVEKAVREVIDNHVRYAGAQGLLTGLGGLVTATVTLPANIAGLALIQARMIAGIAHLRGYDLDDPRVRNAILAAMLGREIVDRLVAERKLAAPPMAIATAPVHDPQLDRVLSGEVASELITRVAGKRLAITIARRVPIVGGAFGMGVDGFATWQVGRYAGGELRPRNRR
jgi:hypothetical protein